MANALQLGHPISFYSVRGIPNVLQMLANVSHRVTHEFDNVRVPNCSVKQPVVYVLLQHQCGVEFSRIFFGC